MCVGPMVRVCVYWPIRGKQKLDTECSPVCRFVETLGFHLGLESWLSFQEVFFLSPLYKQWKRDLKKMSQTHCFHCKHALSSFHQGCFQSERPNQAKTLFGHYISSANRYLSVKMFNYELLLFVLSLNCCEKVQNQQALRCFCLMCALTPVVIHLSTVIQFPHKSVYIRLIVAW